MSDTSASGPVDGGSIRFGHRGYIGSRPYFGQRTPQHVQNLVIRDFCRRKGFTFLLSATEYAMLGCHIMLNEVLAEVGRLEGVVLHSLFMLPRRRERRLAVYDRVLGEGATLHGAVEGLSINGPEDVARVEDIWLVYDALPAAPTETDVARLVRAYPHGGASR